MTKEGTKEGAKEGASGETKESISSNSISSSSSTSSLHVYNSNDHHLCCISCSLPLTPFDPTAMAHEVFNCSFCNTHASEDIGTFRCGSNNCAGNSSINRKTKSCNSCWQKHQNRAFVKCPNGHAVINLGISRSNGWACDGRNHPNGCVRNISGFHQTTGIQRNRCQQCDFDFCDGCCDRVAEELAALRPRSKQSSTKSTESTQQMLSKLSRRMVSLIVKCNGTRWIKQRYLILKELNKMIAPSLHMIDLNLINVVGEKGTSLQWSTASAISKCRHLMFMKIKYDIWNKGIKNTKEENGSTFNLRLSRPKAWKLRKEHVLNGKIDTKLNISLFSQFFKHCSNGTISTNRLRMHSRLYEVKFIGEDAQDAGGPYRESWQDYVSELMSKCLPLFLPVPNEKDPKSANRDQWLPNPNPNQASGMNGEEISTQLHIDAMIFVGQILGIAMRNELCLPFNFSSIIWKALANEKPTLNDIYAIDSTTLYTLTQLREFKSEHQSSFASIELDFNCKSLDGRIIDLIENGSNVPVTYERKDEYCRLLEEYRLHEFDLQLNAMRKGLSMIVPIKLLTLMTWEEVAMFVTGKPGAMDLTLLKKHTTFKRWNGNEPTVMWLWELLEEMEPEDQAAFLKFTWGRTRLPLSSESFIQPFKLTKRSSDQNAYPISHTCFFELEIPEYTSKEIMKEKILYAFTQCTTIDGDGNAGSAEGWED